MRSIDGFRAVWYKYIGLALKQLTVASPRNQTRRGIYRKSITFCKHEHLSRVLNAWGQRNLTPTEAHARQHQFLSPWLRVPALNVRKGLQDADDHVGGLEEGELFCISSGVSRCFERHLDPQVPGGERELFKQRNPRRSMLTYGLCRFLDRR